MNTDMLKRRRKTPIIIAITNGKGGSAKTTVTATLAYLAARSKLKTLAIDFDQQDQLKFFFYPEEEYQNLSDSDFRESDIVANTVNEYLDTISFGKSLYVFSSEEAQDWIEPLRGYLKQLPYDIIFVDNPPGLQSASLTGLGIADYAVISAMTNKVSYRGAIEQIDTIERIQENLNEDLEVLGMVKTWFRNNKHNTKYSTIIDEEFGDLLFSTNIPAKKEAEEWTDDTINERFQGSRILLNVYYQAVFNELTKEAGLEELVNERKRS